MNNKLILLLFTCLCTVNLTAQVTGDVNFDNEIDIIDALLTAQYYVGLNPSPFNIQVSDVNADGSTDIIDALMIAQYYVGLITVFPALQVPPIGEEYKVIRVPIIDMNMFEI